MNCPHCKAELSEGASFCHSCGFDLKKEKPVEMKRQNVDPKVAYGGYLVVGGWLIIIAGAIVAIIIFSQANFGHRGFGSGIFWMGVGVFISTVIYAWLYFGLHKALLKILRIEQALGIDK